MGKPKRNTSNKGPKPPKSGAAPQSPQVSPEVEAARILAKSQEEAARTQAKAQEDAAKIAGRWQVLVSLVSLVGVIAAAYMAVRWATPENLSPQISVVGSTNTAVTQGSHSPAISGVSGGTVNVNYGVPPETHANALARIAVQEEQIAELKRNSQREGIQIPVEKQVEWLRDLTTSFPDGFGIYSWKFGDPVVTPLSEAFHRRGYEMKLDAISVKEKVVPGLSGTNLFLVIPEIITPVSPIRDLSLGVPKTVTDPPLSLSVGSLKHPVRLTVRLLDSTADRIVVALGIRVLPPRPGDPGL